MSNAPTKYEQKRYLLLTAYSQQLGLHKSWRFLEQTPTVTQN